MLKNQSDPNRKVHWFNLCYMIPAPGQWIPLSVMSSYVKRILTKPAMEYIAQANGLPANAVLMNITYLGLASQHTMLGTSDAPVPSKLSEAYRQGLTVAMTSACAVEELTNPYDHYKDQSPEFALNAKEWQAGLDMGISINASKASLSGEPLAPAAPAAE